MEIRLILWRTFIEARRKQSIKTKLLPVTDARKPWSCKRSWVSSTAANACTGMCRLDSKRSRDLCGYASSAASRCRAYRDVFTACPARHCPHLHWPGLLRSYWKEL
jgi:hypothetical protein